MSITEKTVARINLGMLAAVLALLFGMGRTMGGIEAKVDAMWARYCAPTATARPSPSTRAASIGAIARNAP